MHAATGYEAVYRVMLAKETSDGMDFNQEKKYRAKSQKERDYSTVYSSDAS